ncbi:MAG: cytochrome c oxidase subunit II [Alphaproteobacteria bacterium]|nr:cytochrome c oxidase subunit II [Alphaproteobacteria bacterium]
MPPLAAVLSLLALLAAPAAHATGISIPYAEELGKAVLHWGGFPTPVGPVAEKITWLYNMIFLIIAVVFLVVLGPLTYILIRYRKEKVATPATFSHSLRLELLWTIIPALICVFIAYESARAMFKIRTMPADAVNVEVVAYQFGWNFYYPDASENGKHVAAPEPTQNDPEISLPNAPRLAKELVVPVGKPVVLHITAQDVLHAFFVPHLGIKMDAIPGRINYAWFKADQPGNFLGQCAELCGSAHGEMFFRVKAVPQAEYDAFIAAQRVEAGLTPTPVAASATVVVTPTVVTTPTAPAPLAPVVVSASV